MRKFTKWAMIAIAGGFLVHVSRSYFDWAINCFRALFTWSFTEIVNETYAAVPKPPIPFSEMTAFIAIMFAGGWAAYWLAKVKDPDKLGKNDFSPKTRWQMLVHTLSTLILLWFMVTFVIVFGVEDHVKNLREKYHRVLTYAAPHLTDRQEKQFGARFIMIQTKADYDILIDDITETMMANMWKESFQELFDQCKESLTENERKTFQYKLARAKRSNEYHALCDEVGALGMSKTRREAFETLISAGTTILSEDQKAEFRTRYDMAKTQEEFATLIVEVKRAIGWKP